MDKAVRHVRGVTGIINNTVVRAPAASPDPVEAIIEQAFERQAEAATRHIRVKVSDHTVGLHGHVHSLQEATVAGTSSPSGPSCRWWAGGCRWRPR